MKTKLTEDNLVKSYKKTKELDWEKEFQKLFLDDPYEKGIIYASGDNVKDFIQSLLSTQRQEILGEVLKTIGKVKFYKCKDTESVDYGEMIPCERIDIDELREEIKSLKQNEK